MVRYNKKDVDHSMSLDSFSTVDEYSSYSGEYANKISSMSSSKLKQKSNYSDDYEEENSQADCDCVFWDQLWKQQTNEQEDPHDIEQVQVNKTSSSVSTYSSTSLMQKDSFYLADAERFVNTVSQMLDTTVNFAVTLGKSPVGQCAAAAAEEAWNDPVCMSPHDLAKMKRISEDSGQPGVLLAASSSISNMMDRKSNKGSAVEESVTTNKSVDTTGSVDPPASIQSDGNKSNVPPVSYQKILERMEKQRQEDEINPNVKEVLRVGLGRPPTTPRKKNSNSYEDKSTTSSRKKEPENRDLSASRSSKSSGSISKLFTKIRSPNKTRSAKNEQVIESKDAAHVENKIADEPIADIAEESPTTRPTSPDQRDNSLPDQSVSDSKARSLELEPITPTEACALSSSDLNERKKSDSMVKKSLNFLGKKKASADHDQHIEATPATPQRSASFVQPENPVSGQIVEESNSKSNSSEPTPSIEVCALSSNDLSERKKSDSIMKKGFNFLGKKRAPVYNNDQQIEATPTPQRSESFVQTDNALPCQTVEESKSEAKSIASEPPPSIKIDERSSLDVNERNDDSMTQKSFSILGKKKVLVNYDPEQNEIELSSYTNLSMSPSNFATSQSIVSQVQHSISNAQSNISKITNSISNSQSNFSKAPSNIGDSQSNISKRAQSSIKNSRSDFSKAPSSIKNARSNISKAQNSIVGNSQSNISKAQHSIIGHSQSNISKTQSSLIGNSQSNVSKAQHSIIGNSQSNISKTQSSIGIARSNVSNSRSVNSSRTSSSGNSRSVNSSSTSSSGYSGYSSSSADSSVVDRKVAELAKILFRKKAGMPPDTTRDTNQSILLKRKNSILAAADEIVIHDGNSPSA